MPSLLNGKTEGLEDYSSIYYFSIAFFYCRGALIRLLFFSFEFIYIAFFFQIYSTFYLAAHEAFNKLLIKLNTVKTAYNPYFSTFLCIINYKF